VAFSKSRLGQSRTLSAFLDHLVGGIDAARVAHRSGLRIAHLGPISVKKDIAPKLCGTMSALGHKRTCAAKQACPLYSQKRTFVGVMGMSAWAVFAIFGATRKRTRRMLTEMLWLFGITATAIALAWVIWWILNFFVPND
jgi:hypothetical protein